jgi:hypothetical protein
MKTRFFQLLSFSKPVGITLWHNVNFSLGNGTVLNFFDLIPQTKNNPPKEQK